ncbi:hypothetical protein V8N76_004525 [Salmonella enterica]
MTDEDENPLRRQAREELAVVMSLPAHMREHMKPVLRRLEAILDGRPVRQFDWMALARLIVERQPLVVECGMAEDRFWTMKPVWVAGEGVQDPSVNSSVWATPVVTLDDGDEIECWREVSADNPESEPWPEEALAILIKEKVM